MSWWGGKFPPSPFWKAGQSKTKCCADKCSCHPTSISAVGISSGLQYLFPFLHLSFCGVIQCGDKVAWKEMAEDPLAAESNLQRTCNGAISAFVLLLSFCNTE